MLARTARCGKVLRKVTAKHHRTPETASVHDKHESPALRSSSENKRTPLAEMMPAVYDDLRRLAAAYLRGERTAHTLQRTALVHEAYLRLQGQEQLQWQDPGHFVGIFARVMRQTLINHAVARRRLKRGGADAMRLTLDFYESRKIDVTVLDQALEALEGLDRRQAEIVELRFFGGLSVEEVAKVLHISPATVKRDWMVAKVWLQRELSATFARQ